MKKHEGNIRFLGQVKNYHLLFMTLLWVLLVLYPNPFQLGKSIQRILQPPVNPAMVAVLVEKAPEHPRAIEEYVLETFPYQYDWQTYGMPWYFPTLEEALEKGTGDCKTRFVVLASIFEAKEIPYQLSFSLSHFWVNYEGKEENSWETGKNAFLLREDDGSLKLQVPREDQRQIRQNFVDGFWHAMPEHRKVLLLLGPGINLALGIFLYGLRKSRKTPSRPVAVDA